MYRKEYGFCELVNKNVTIEVEQVPYNSNEGTVYAKGKIRCGYSDTTYHCERNDCPIWRGLDS
jgi:hypothetical protein|nr:MAG TPA: hypothetical protein [Caudoviricetes sp.]